MNALLANSHTKGPTEPPLVEQTIGQALSAAAAEAPDAEALISRHQNKRLTYAGLDLVARQLALALLDLGIAPGDRVGIWAPNCWEWTVVQYATAKAGIILVNINPAYRSAELEYALNKVGCTALITAQSFKTSDYIAILERLAPELTEASSTDAYKPLQADGLPDMRHVITLGDDLREGCLRFADVLQQGADLLATDEGAARLAEAEASVQPRDPINIQFTSGTTGSPKGATLSHHNILNNAFFCGQRMRFSSADRLCIPVPLYHCFGMVMGNLTCLNYRAAAIYPSDAFDPELCLDTVAAERCTALYGVPTMFVAMLEAQTKNPRDVSQLRTGVMAGSPCPVEVMKATVSELNMTEVTIGYGMTETSPLSWQTDADDTLERRVTTVGTAHPHAEVMVADEHGEPIPCGEQGEFLTRGYMVMLGYWDDEERTHEAISDDGWMRTGDLGVIDEHGYGQVTGRLKDMIIRGGENIYPREIEEFLFRHEAIQDAQVFGVPDHRYGEQVAAWIIVKSGAELSEAEVQSFCRDQLAHFKVPFYVRFVEEFPMTVTGKARKIEMREAMVKEFQI